MEEVRRQITWLANRYKLNDVHIFTNHMRTTLNFFFEDDDDETIAVVGASISPYTSNIWTDIAENIFDAFLGGEFDSAISDWSLTPEERQDAYAFCFHSNEKNLQVSQIFAELPALLMLAPTPGWRRFIRFNPEASLVDSTPVCAICSLCSCPGAVDPLYHLRVESPVRNDVKL